MLFVVPLQEPERPAHAANAAWKPTMPRRCWAGLGPYTLSGTIHIQQGHDPAAHVRLFDKQFLPLTQARIKFPDGTVSTYGTVIVNRFHLDVVAIKDSF